MLNAPDLSVDARHAMQAAAIAGDSVYVPAISLAEILYLIEKGRFLQNLLTQILKSVADPLAELKVIPFDEHIAQAMQQIPRPVVPEMPDRIIAATALFLDLPLVTRDHKIQSVKLIKTIW
ncbi:MAG: PIN domain-containing protein [Acidobacteriota bacterium]